MMRLKANDALQRATTAVNQGRAHEAEQIVRDVLNKDPNEATALHLLGCARLLQDRVADAIEPLERAARMLRDPALDTRLAYALRKVGRTDDALSRLKRATMRKPPYPFAFHELGFLLYSLRRYDEATVAI